MGKLTGELTPNYDNILNSTYDEEELNKLLHTTVENSFQFLKRVQKSYSCMERFHFTQANFFVDKNYPTELCISVPKDFIDATKRKVYKYSKYFGKYITYADIAEDLSEKQFKPEYSPETVFEFTPCAIVDNRVALNVCFKCTLDGRTEIVFHDLPAKPSYFKEKHNIEVFMLRNTWTHSFLTNTIVLKNILDAKAENYIFSKTLTGVLMKGTPIFYTVRCVNKTTKNCYEIMGNSLNYGRVDDEGNLVVPATDWLKNYFAHHGGNTFEITFFHPNYMYEVEGIRSLRKRTSNENYSCIAVIQEEEGVPYNMPIPEENIIIFFKDKTTGEVTYFNYSDLTRLHYPNIYEIVTTKDVADKYDVKLFYLYRPMERYLRYTNQFDYIHKFFKKQVSDKYGETNLEGALNKLLYDKVDPSLDPTKKYFESTFEYEDPDYIYNHGDFINSKQYPDSYDYKIDKANQWGLLEPKPQEKYIGATNPTSDLYYMYAGNVDLPKRERNSTAKEDPKNPITFEETRYLLVFRNDGPNSLQLRYFIDGLLCTKYLQIHVGEFDYIYIPKEFITPMSHIVIERFDYYSYYKKHAFKSTDEVWDMDFTDASSMIPTWHDLFVRKDEVEKIDKDLFTFYTLVNMSDYNKKLSLAERKEKCGIPADVEVIDGEKGEMYMKITPDVVKDLPKYMHLTRMKVKLNDASKVNVTYTFIVNKDSFIRHDVTPPMMNVQRYGILKNAIPWIEEASYLRTFVDRRRIVCNIKIESNGPYKLVARTDYFPTTTEYVQSTDVTPYSYKRVAFIPEIPENYMIDTADYLDTPFSLDYYEVYLNGRRLFHYNIECITGRFIKLYNVISRLNLAIYKKDMDPSIFSTNKPNREHTPMDEFLNNPDIDNKTKDDFLDWLIKDKHGELDGKPGENLEPNVNDAVTPDADTTDMKRFYTDIIIPRGVTKPQSWILDGTNVQNNYPAVWTNYQKNNKIVIRPNFNYNGLMVMMLSRYTEV